jgi:hypothetical protein
MWVQLEETHFCAGANGAVTLSTPETLDRLALPAGSDQKEMTAATMQAGIFALDVALSIVEAPTDETTAARRLQYVAGRCDDLTGQLIGQAGEG